MVYLFKLTSFKTFANIILNLVVGGKVTQTMRPVTATTTCTTTTSASPVHQPPQKVIIRSVPTKTIISANNVVKIAPEPQKVNMKS